MKAGLSGLGVGWGDMQTAQGGPGLLTGLGGPREALRTELVGSLLFASTCFMWVVF